MGTAAAFLFLPIWVSSELNDKGGGNAPFALFLGHALLRKTLHRHAHSLCVVGGLACIMGVAGWVALLVGEGH